MSVDDSGDTYDVNTLNAESYSETIDNLEVEQLYGSDDEEYIPNPDNESDDEAEERNAVGSKRREESFSLPP